MEGKSMMSNPEPGQEGIGQLAPTLAGRVLVLVFVMLPADIRPVD
jgi:hypothetical protein